MARIEDLIDEIADPDLRDQIAREVKELKATKRFGLVYEEQVPETVALFGLPIRPGSVVQRRTEPDDPGWYEVIATEGAVASIVPVGTEQPIEEVAIADLLTVKRFDQPIYPGLTPVGEVRRDRGDKPAHTVISGENYHALQLLAYTQAGKVDVIYIDPPYNTEDKTWKYNNHFVDKNDSYRHSKWLSMMEKRLRLSKKLLKPDGVLIVTIDEHELFHLGVLMEDLFGDFSRYMISIVTNSRGTTGTGDLGVIEEQALIAVPPGVSDRISPRESVIPQRFRAAVSDEALTLAQIAESLPDIGQLVVDAGGQWDETNVAATKAALSATESPDEVEEDSEEGVYWTSAIRSGQGTSFRSDRPNQFYPIFIDSDMKRLVDVGEPLLETDEDGQLIEPSWEPVGDLLPVWPTDEDGELRVWCFEHQRMRAEIEAGNLVIGRFNKKRNAPAINVRRIRQRKGRYRDQTVWWESAYDTGANGTTVLKDFLGRSKAFPFPKSIYAVRDTLATVVGDRLDALVVDFFAGSGTTLHALMLLNDLDEGKRRAILVTNNEVDAATADALHAGGVFPGDPVFEAQGVFEAVTLPRVTAAVSGVTPDGDPVSGRYTWAGKRPYAEGFEENVAFFRMDYLEPDLVELGRQYEAIAPLLWMAAGSVGRWEPWDGVSVWSAPEDSTYAVLFDESEAAAFGAYVESRSEEITHAWIVTDSHSAYLDLRAQIPTGVEVGQLYRDYLRNFVVNAPGATR